jgi:hypothetical protein
MIEHDKQCENMLYPPDANPMHMCHCETRLLRMQLAAMKADRDSQQRGCIKAMEDTAEWRGKWKETLERAQQAEADLAAAQMALKHQRMALYIVRDRQAGIVSIADLNQGIALIDKALAGKDANTLTWNEDTVIPKDIT